MKKIYLVLLLMLGANDVIQAQSTIVDTKNESVFTYTTTKDVSVQLTTESPFTISKAFELDSVQFAYRDKRTGQSVATMVRHRQLYTELSMINSGEDGYLNLQKMKVGIGAKIGIQWAVNKFNRLDIVGGAHTGGFNFVFKAENVSIYNTNVNLAQDKWPTTYGIEGYYNWFLPTGNHPKWVQIIALNGKLQRTWNKADLKNYQDINEVTVTPTVVALEDFRGKYGPYQSGINNARMSLAWSNYFWQINVTPYAVYNFVASSSPNYRLGSMFSILSVKMKTEGIELPSSIGFGIDFLHKNGYFDKPGFIIAGTIKI